jgi:hypothetical protein
MQPGTTTHASGQSTGRISVIPLAWCAVALLVLVSAFRTVRWPYVDLVNNFETAANGRPWGEAIGEAFSQGLEYRPLLTLATRVSYAVLGLTLSAYKVLVVLQFAAILAALLFLFRPTGWRQGIAAAVALSIAVGLHTSQILFLFLPLNAYATSMVLVLAAAVLALTPHTRGYEWVLLPLTLLALLWLELGVLIVPLVAIAWLMNAPGTTWRSVVASVSALAAYGLIRLTLSSGAGLTSPETGLGFATITPAQSAELFAHGRWLLWLYNVSATLMTVLFSEPRSGKFEFTRALLDGEVAGWMWLHVLTSLVTTAFIFGALPGVRRRPPRDRLVAAFGAVLIVGGGALGFLYTRDRIALPVGLGYAMLAYAAMASATERRGPAWRTITSGALVAVLAVVWSVRAAEAYVGLRDTAWSYYVEWAARYEELGGTTRPQTPLLAALRASALKRRPADAARDPVWTYSVFERRFKPIAQAPCSGDARLVVNTLYRHVLDGDANDAAASTWVTRLADGSATVRDVVRSIVLSPEYRRRFDPPASPEDAAATLYRHLFAREADPGGVRWAAQGIATHGLTAIIEQLLASEEYEQRFGDWGVPGSNVRFCR